MKKKGTSIGSRLITMFLGLILIIGGLTFLNAKTNLGSVFRNYLNFAQTFDFTTLTQHNPNVDNYAAAKNGLTQVESASEQLLTQAKLNATSASAQVSGKLQNLIASSQAKLERVTANATETKKQPQGNNAKKDSSKADEQTTVTAPALAQVYTPIKFNGQKQLVLGDFDSLKRATYSHIQLQYKDMPRQNGLVRDAKINVDPVGWHNYNIPYRDANNNTKKAWLMNRGHLVGYQFSGLNDELKNLVPETAWINQGNFNSMDDTNPQSQLFFEMKLANWLKQHPNDWLDFQVTPVYTANNLIPDCIKFDYVGISSDGKNIIPINFGNKLETTDKNGVTEATIKNISPNAVINYKDGTQGAAILN